MSLETIKKLREGTGAGMVDIKEALDEAGNDEIKAVEILRKAGQKIAAKKAERSANEGAIALARAGNRISVVSLACETDFVARNENFLQAAGDFAKQLLSTGKNEFKAWAEAQIQNSLIVMIGENIRLNDFEIIEGNLLGSYLHSNKKVAAVAVMEDGTEEQAKEIAMHVAAMSPSYLKPEGVPEEVIIKEKEIYREQLAKEGKSE